MTTRVSLPGMRSPGAGFDQPFEMLDACHDRVRRSLDLLRRLRDYLRGHGHGCDDSARQAARDVLRYFDLAAPLHHEDEERHVLPRLAASADAESRALAALLQQEHRRQETLWQVLREPLAAWAAEPAEGAAPPPERFPAPDALSEFQALYARHIAREESVAYPQARADFPAAALAAMSEDMTARRRPARP